MNTAKFWTKKLLIYCCGFFLIAIGVCFSIKSDLGVSPVSSTPYVISLISGIEFGLCTTLVYISFILLQIILMGKNFKIINLLQIANSSLFGLFVTLAGLATTWLPTPTNYMIRLLYCGIAIFLIALGIMFYLGANVLSLPGEGAVQAIAYRFHIIVPTAKTIFDCSVVCLAIALSFIFTGTLVGIREGTVLTAIFVGFCLKFLQKKFQHKLDKFLAPTT
ncbi:MAG: DUF6198 family protein [Eubacteriales bacterium]